MEESSYAIQEDECEEEQRKKEHQREEELCFEEKLGEEVQREEVCCEKVCFKKSERPEIWSASFEVRRARDASDERREAEIGAQRQEGHESEAGDRDRIVGGSKEGSQGAPSEEELVGMSVS